MGSLVRSGGQFTAESPRPRLKWSWPPLISQLEAHWITGTAHSVFSLTRLTRFRPSVRLPWSWGARSGAVASLLQRAPDLAWSEAGHSLLHRPPYPALSEAGHHWLSELLAHVNPGTAHSVSSLTRLTRFRPSVWLPWSWGAQSGVVATFFVLHRAPHKKIRPITFISVRVYAGNIKRLCRR